MRHPTVADWLKMAKAFDVPRWKRGAKEKDHFGFGICWSFDRLRLENNILYGLRPKGKLFWWPRTTRGDRERAFFCIMMAAVTEKGDLMGMLE